MIITELQIVHLALKIDNLLLEKGCYAGEDTANEILADWLINNQIQTI